MKIAVVEKRLKSDYCKEFFNFDYDRFELTHTDSNRVLKKDITLDLSVLEEYDYIILVGKEPVKHIAKINDLMKFSGELIDDKYIPIINPIAIKFNPGIKNSLESSLKKLHSHIDGSYKVDIGVYTPITRASDAKKWLNNVLRSQVSNVVLDLETSSLYPRDGYILGLAMSSKEGEGVYIDSDCIDQEIEGLLQKLVNKKTIIFHNAKFDIQWLRFHFNLKITKWHDTMLQHYLLNENEPHDLKYLVLKYTNMGEYDKELDEFKKSYIKSHGLKVAEFSYEYIPFDIMYKYAAADADGSLRLFNKFNPLIKKHFNKLYNEILLEGTKFLLEMENNGVPFSKEHLVKAHEEITLDIFNLKNDLYDNCKEIYEIEKEQNDKFNPNSTAQLKKLFFDKLNLPVIKHTPKGEPSTDKFVLEELAGLHPVPNIINNIRKKVKMQSTYITKILKGLDTDGRLRTGFHLHTVTSGRLSSSGKLNMQQLPRDDKTVKKCIRSNKENYVIFSQDLKTAEMYYAAVLSNDAQLANVFKKGGDFHSNIAIIAFGLSCKAELVPELYPELRQASKAISFGILYGAGPGKIASELGCSTEEAKKIISKYFYQFNTLKNWLEKTKSQIQSDGFIYSAFGRKRRVPDAFSNVSDIKGHAIRSALNFTIQSVASDVNLLGAIDAQKEIKKLNLPVKLFGLVHDSILGECPEEHIILVEDILRRNTQKDRGVSIKGCPVGLDFSYGESYADT